MQPAASVRFIDTLYLFVEFIDSLSELHISVLQRGTESVDVSAVLAAIQNDPILAAASWSVIKGIILLDMLTNGNLYELVDDQGRIIQHKLPFFISYLYFRMSTRRDGEKTSKISDHCTVGTDIFFTCMQLEDFKYGPISCEIPAWNCILVYRFFSRLSQLPLWKELQLDSRNRQEQSFD